MKQELIIYYLGFLLILVICLVGCSGGTGGSTGGGDDDEASDADKQAILCDKLAACHFEEALGAQDCPAYAKELSDWLMECAMRATGCGDLADCFNLPEGD